MRPCKECPFRVRSAPGYVGGHADAMEILHIVRMDGKFPCHLEVNRIMSDMVAAADAFLPDEDTDESDEGYAFRYAVGEAPFCTGALIFMNQTAKRSRDPAVCKLQDKAGKSKTVFGSANDFLTHHKSKAHAAATTAALPACPPQKKKPRRKRPS